MSGAQGVIAGIEADAEVELSADDLRELADYGDFTAREPARLTRPPTAQAAPPPQAATAKASARRYITAPRLGMALTLTLGIVCALYVLTTNRETAHLSAHIADRASHSQWPAPQATVEPEPVRFANPFDADEVFEFAPGTTDDEAREAVAQILVERAMERQR